VQLVDDDHGDAGVEADAADRLDDVSDVGPAGNGQAEEPASSVAIILPVAAGGTVM